MSKELEALKEARNFRHEKDKNLVVIDIDYFNQCLDGIETALKALEIIREKKVNVWTLFKVGLKRYNDEFTYQEQRKLTQEEYDLLKEVLKSE